MKESGVGKARALSSRSRVGRRKLTTKTTRQFFFFVHASINKIEEKIDDKNKKGQIKIDGKNNASKKAKKTLKRISEFTPEKG